MSDTEARDQLGLIISAYRRNAEVAWDEDLMLADHLLEQGWRPPARTVTTVEELDALPELAVIRDSEGTVAECAFGQWYSTDGDHYWHGVLALPATVLYEPKEGE